MKIKLFTFSNDICFKENNLNVLEIANKKLFSNTIINFYNIIVNNESKEKIILLDENENEIDIFKHTLLVNDIISFDYNNRKIQSKIMNMLEKSILQNDLLRLDLDTKINALVTLIPEVISDYSIDFIWEEQLSLQNIIKFFAIKIDQPYDNSFLGRTLKIIDVANDLELCNILIFYNLKMFLAEDELIELYKYIKYKEINVLIIESIVEERILYHERKLIIDNDFNDYVIK